MCYAVSLLFTHAIMFFCPCCFQGPEGDQTVALALSKPEQFVLKPQREGGGILRELSFHSIAI